MFLTVKHLKDLCRHIVLPVDRTAKKFQLIELITNEFTRSKCSCVTETKKSLKLNFSYDKKMILEVCRDYSIDIDQPHTLSRQELLIKLEEFISGVAQTALSQIDEKIVYDVREFESKLHEDQELIKALNKIAEWHIGVASVNLISVLNKELKIMPGLKPSNKEQLIALIKYIITNGKVHRELTDDRICGVRYDKEINDIMLPCLHTFCSACSKQIKICNNKCPYCRRPSTGSYPIAPNYNTYSREKENIPPSLTKN